MLAIKNLIKRLYVQFSSHFDIYVEIWFPTIGIWWSSWLFSPDRFWYLSLGFRHGTDILNILFCICDDYPPRILCHQNICIRSGSQFSCRCFYWDWILPQESGCQSFCHQVHCHLEIWKGHLARVWLRLAFVILVVFIWRMLHPFSVSVSEFHL